MKPLTLVAILIPLTMIFSGCSALYTDREFGKAQMISYDSQVAYPDYRYVQETPNTLEGIFAEDVMLKYSGSFKEGFTKQEIDITSTGIETNQ